MVAEAAVATRVTSDPVTNPVSPRVPVDSPALKVVAGRAAVEGPLLNAAGRRRAVIGDVEGVDAGNGRIAVEEDECIGAGAGRGRHSGQRRRDLTGPRRQSAADGEDVHERARRGGGVELAVEYRDDPRVVRSGEDLHPSRGPERDIEDAGR